jgi:hypothetical protein
MSKARTAAPSPTLRSSQNSASREGGRGAWGGTSTKYRAGMSSANANGQALAWVYSRADSTEAYQAKVLTADEGRRIAANIARLPDLLGKGERQQG